MTDTQPKPLVSQRAREYAAGILISREAEQKALDGKIDDNPVVQAFASFEAETLASLSREVTREALRPAIWGAVNDGLSVDDALDLAVTALIAKADAMP